MGTQLPEALEALALIFGTPGGFPRGVFLRAAAGAWTTPRLRAALHRLANSDPEGLEAAYADHFLYNAWQPVLHLEASVYRHGHLCDQDILEDLKELHQQMGVVLPPGRCPDHLASGLEALARGLRNLGGGGWSPAREEAVWVFTSRHLLPQVEGLKRVGNQRPLHPVFEGALEGVEILLEEIVATPRGGASPTGRPSYTS